MARVVRLGANQAAVAAQIVAGDILPGTVYVSIDGLLDGDEVIGVVKDATGGAVLRVGLTARRTDTAGLTAFRDAKQSLSDNATTQATTLQGRADGFQAIIDLADDGIIEE